MLSHPVVVAAAVVAVLSSGSWSTSPPPPPYHQYTVQGTLDRLSGGNRENFAVVLLAKVRYEQDSTFRILRGIAYPSVRDHPIGLTDSAGVFTLRVSTYLPADSLRVGVVIPDMPMTLGAPFPVDTSSAVPNREWYTPQAEPGCSGCGTEPMATERIVYYSYYINGLTVSIEF